jgi:hypothetical protein
MQRAVDDPSFRALLSETCAELREELAVKNGHIECSLGTLHTSLARTENAVDRVESRLGSASSQEEA